MIAAPTSASIECPNTIVFRHGATGGVTECGKPHDARDGGGGPFGLGERFLDRLRADDDEHHGGGDDETADDGQPRGIGACTWSQGYRGQTIARETLVDDLCGTAPVAWPAGYCRRESCFLTWLAYAPSGASARYRS